MEEERRARLWASLLMVGKDALAEYEEEKEAERRVEAMEREAAADLLMLTEYCERGQERVRRKREKEQREREEKARKREEIERRAHRLLQQKALKKPATTIDHHRCSCGCSSSPSSSLIKRWGKGEIFEAGECGTSTATNNKRRTFEKGVCSTSPPTTISATKKPKKTTPPVPQQRSTAPIVINVMPDEQLRRCIEQMGGSPSETVLVIEKNLTKTDVSRGQGRLSLPLAQLKSPHFLTPQEQHTLTLRTNEGSPNEISVPLLQLPGNRLSTVKLKRWDMRKESGNTSSTYVLCNTWNTVVTRNLLHAGHRIQIWSFRVESVLHLAIIRMPR